MGEEVSGVVRVTAGENLACRRLTVKCEWRATSERGKSESGPEQEQQPFSGTWQAGEVAPYPFEFIPAASPLAHRGVFRNGEWYVRARAELFDRFDVLDVKAFTTVADEPNRRSAKGRL